MLLSTKNSLKAGINLQIYSEYFVSRSPVQNQKYLKNPKLKNPINHAVIVNTFQKAQNLNLKKAQNLSSLDLTSNTKAQTISMWLYVLAVEKNA